MKIMGPLLQERREFMKQLGNTLSKRTAIKQQRRLGLTWKPLYTRIIGATLSLLLLLVFEFFLFKLIFAWS